MKNSTKIIIVLLLIIILAGGIYFIIQNQKITKRNECIKECYYTEKSESGRLYNIEGWHFDNRLFETREQCLDYCIAIR